MCGICGWLNFAGDNYVDPALLKKMNDTLALRGPDGEGFHVDKNLGFGHRRLSIIDVATGQQPLSNEDGSVWITFNGEIYNYLELMEQLRAKGCNFRTSSDTEVLVHLFEEKGPAMVDDLVGMFAFAIWETKEQRLTIFRDRLGKKPLYYSCPDGKSLLFASEIKALLASGMVRREVDLPSLDHYLSFLYTPRDASIFQGIKKLPAAHCMVVEKGQVSLHKYWDLTYPEQPTVRSEEQCLAEFEDIFNDAVRVRLRSDVPLGAFLSGGIDSSAVVAAMQEQNQTPVETVTVGFAEEEYNETPYAAEIAKHLGCNYNEHIVSPKIEEIFTQLVSVFDEPFADSSSVPTYYVSKAARERVTVALSGDGGDELLAGYSRHSIEMLEHKIRSRSGFVPAALWRALYRALPAGTKGRNIFGDLGQSAAEAAARKHSNVLFTEELKRRVYARDELLTDVSANFRALYEGSTAKTALDKALYLDIQTYLIDDILVKVDRMSMANSLEVRAPLLDHRILEFLTTVPPEMKYRDGVTKYLLKKMVAKKLPAEIINRKKHGFRLPIEMWLKNELRSFVEDLLFSRTCRERGLFQVAEVEKMWRQFLDGNDLYAHHFWQLTVLEQWFRSYIDAPDAEVGTAR